MTGLFFVRDASYLLTQIVRSDINTGGIIASDGTLKGGRLSLLFHIDFRIVALIRIH